MKLRRKQRVNGDILYMGCCLLLTGSCDGQYGPFSLSPLSLLLLKAISGISKEHHIFFALNLSLQELKARVVKAQHILRRRDRVSKAASLMEAAKLAAGGTYIP